MKLIIKGTINNLLDRNSLLLKDRLEICSQCPLFKRTKLGLMCNNSLYMNKDGEVKDKVTPGYKPGCGCFLNSKLRNEDAQCPHNKW